MYHKGVQIDQISFRVRSVEYNESCSWWRRQMETFSALLAICAGNPPVPGEFPTQRPVTRCFDVFFDLRLNKRLSKQPRGWWFETQSWSLWRHCSVTKPSRVCSPSISGYDINATVSCFNSSPPSAAYMRQWNGPALVQATACRLYGAKSLPEPMLTYCQLNPQG